MNPTFIRNVLIKAVILFIGVNLICILVSPSALGTISIYNSILLGRQRLPFGEDSAQSYNLSLFNLDAMFASHVITGSLDRAHEYRVIIVGDSSTWGILLHPEETLAGQLDAEHLILCGRAVNFYNLGYPTISLTKDLMLLDYARKYKPDLVIWPVTLEAFPSDKQLTTPLIVNNVSRVELLNERYKLDLNTSDSALIRPTFWDLTIPGQRRALADLFRLQLYGVMWAATGIDQTYPIDYQHTSNDLSSDVTFHSMSPSVDMKNNLAFNVLEAGFQAVGKTPVILVNEPMFISTGQNSQLRYNFLYPRWAYDQYRELMSIIAQANGWSYLDLWDLVPNDDFTNSAIHLSPSGESVLAGFLKNTILQQSCR
jgi:hypothetical protein